MSKLDSVSVGDELEAYVVESIDPERLKTMAALYDDPNPIHFDLAASRARGLTDRLIQQGAANIAFLLEPAIRLAGDPEAVRGYDVRLMGNMFAGDRVECSGKVVAVDEEAGTVTVELVAEVGGEAVASGTAVLAG